MNTKKAAGVDGVPGEIAKLVASRRSELVTRAFNGITESGRIPDCWKEFDKRKLPWKVKRLIGGYLSERRIIVSN